MQRSQHRANNGYGEKSGSRWMPVLPDDDAGQKHHQAPEGRAQRITEAYLHSFVQDFFSNCVLCAAKSGQMIGSAGWTAQL